MRKKLIIISLTIASFGLVLSAKAQTWAQRLANEERNYEEGRLTGIPERLQGGLDLPQKEGGFTKEERIRAHKLITKVYIFIDDEPEAEASLVRLLKADKEHRLNPLSDPAELYFLYEKFRTKPIFRISAKIGANKSFPNVIETFNPSNTNTVKKVYNGNGEGPGEATPNGSLGIGYWAELTAQRHLWYGIEVGLGFNLRRSEYDVDSYVGQNDSGDPTLISFIKNRQMNLRFPVFARYNFRYFADDGPIPYITLGLTYDRLLNAEYLGATRRGGTAFSLATNNNLKDLELVNLNNMSAILAIGVKLRVQTHFLTLEARFDRGLFNYVNSDNRWSGNQFLTYDLGYVEDDLALDMFSLSLGYTYSVYSPKKLKEFR